MAVFRVQRYEKKKKEIDEEKKIESAKEVAVGMLNGASGSV
jgi:hypothetical protein